MKDTKTIKCPFCGTEYLPGEIFLPKTFLGQPIDIERDINGKILIYDGVEQNLEEDFCCEKCGKKFKINATINYDIKEIKPKATDYVSDKYNDRLFLKED